MFISTGDCASSFLPTKTPFCGNGYLFRSEFTRKAKLQYYICQCAHTYFMGNYVCNYVVQCCLLRSLLFLAPLEKSGLVAHNRCEHKSSFCCCKNCCAVYLYLCFLGHEQLCIVTQQGVYSRVCILSTVYNKVLCTKLFYCLISGHSSGATVTLYRFSAMVCLCGVQSPLCVAFNTRLHEGVPLEQQKTISLAAQCFLV